MQVVLSYVCLLFTILHPFGTKKSIRRKVDHEGHIVLHLFGTKESIRRKVDHGGHIVLHLFGTK